MIIMLDTKKITQQAKKIMDDFVKELDKAGSKNLDFTVERDANIRDDKPKLQTNADFRDRMLKNAPNVKNNCIVAEKKKW